MGRRGAGSTRALALLWRPLWYASVDPDTAEARGVPTRALGVAFPVLLAVAVAETIQVTGVPLILTLVVTPAAAAHQLTTRPASAVAVSVGLAVAATIGGILASLAWNAPTSFFIATFSFTAYIGTRLISRRPAARGNSWKPSTTNPPVTNPPVTTTTTD